MLDTSDKKFVYEGKEWSLTGRTARKAIFSKRNPNTKIGTMTIVEIAPLGLGGSDPIFHKWVDPRELFYIEETSTIDIDAIKEDNSEFDHEDD